MKPLSEIFEIISAQNLELINCKQSDDGFCFVSRASGNNGAVARIEKVNDLEPMPAHAITVALGGSVLSTFYQSEEFYTAFHIASLYPKQPLTKSEMLYYCYVIEQNKYRYNYGRQANRTLRNILVPEYHEIPNFVKQTDTESENFFPTTPLSPQKLELHTENWRWFRVGDLFEEIVPTNGTTTNNLKEGNGILYIAAKKEQNGVAGEYDFEQNKEFISRGNCIVFIHIGEGSAGYSLYQPNDFIGMNGKTSCGYFKQLNPYVGQFLVTILDFERPRYSFGRSWTGNRLIDTKIKLPATPAGDPDFQFMEDYIKSLPYSGCL